VNLVGERHVSLLERSLGRSEIGVQSRALDRESGLAAGREQVDRRYKREKERNDRSAGNGVESNGVDRAPPTNDVTIEEAVRRVADRARTSFSTSLCAGSESRERSKASSSTLPATA